MAMEVYRPARHAHSQARLRLRRMLTRPGRVLVQPGQQVAPTDLVARRAARYQLDALPLARLLRVPPQRVREFLRCQPGQQVARGDVLAVRKGLFRREVTAPFDARVLGLLHGYLLVQRVLEEERLVAGVYGEVEDTFPLYGASLRAHGLILEGVWGNGRTSGGPLLMLPEGFPQGALMAEHLTLELRGSVVVAQTLADSDALEQAREVALEGLVMAYLTPPLLEAAREMPFPVLVLEGFRERPFSSAAHQLLEGLERQEVVICADPPRRDLGTWPWLFVPREAFQAATPLREGEPLQPGARVRILRGPWQGEEAQVEELLSSPYVLPSGFQGYVVKLRLNGQAVLVPLTNVEVVG